MSERTDVEYLTDILEAIRRISTYLGGTGYEIFRDDLKTQDAVIRNIEIIGEAAKGISEGLRTKNSQFPWQSMAGMLARLS